MEILEKAQKFLLKQKLELLKRKEKRLEDLIRRTPWSKRKKLQEKLNEVRSEIEKTRRLLKRPKAKEEDELRTLRSIIRRSAKYYEGGGYGRIYLSSFPSEEYDEIEKYAIEPMKAYVSILRHKRRMDYIYYVSEPVLSVEEMEELERIDRLLRNTLLMPPEKVERGRREYIRQLVDELFSYYSIEMPAGTAEKIKYYLVRNYGGYGPIDVMMRDPQIEDISCDGVGVPVYVYHRKYGSLRTNVVFRSEADLDNFVMKLAVLCGKHISVADPLLDATLPDGSRLQATFRNEVTTRGSTFTIRRFREKPFTPIELIKNGTATTEIMAYLWFLVEHGMSGIIFGGTAAGKTTLLNAISMFIPPNEKIVSIEDTREINLPHENWIPSVARESSVPGTRSIDMYDLLKAALRQRPRYIIVGEVRGREAYVMFQAMATGHTTYSTFHAESPQALVHRFTHEPINIPKSLFTSVDFLVHIQQLRNPRTRLLERKIVSLFEVLGYNPAPTPTQEEILMNVAFKFNPVERITKRETLKLIEKISISKGTSKRELEEDVMTRKKVLEWAMMKNYHSYEEFSRIVFRYYDDKPRLLQEVEEDLENMGGEKL